MTFTPAMVNELLRKEAERDPRVVALATFVSLASRIEPAVVRAVRTSLVTSADAGVEADFWFSRLVEASDASATVLVPEVATALRQRLAADASTSELKMLWELLSSLHAGSPPVLRSEELLAYLSIRPTPEARNRIAEEIHRFRRSLDDEQGQDLAEWLTDAVRRFPAEARMTLAGEALGRAVAARTRSASVRHHFLRTTADASSRSLDGSKRMTIGLRALPSGLELSAPPVRGALELPIPPTDPPVLDVAWPTDEGWESERYTITPREAQVVTLPFGVPWRLSTLDGDEISVRIDIGRKRPVLWALGDSVDSDRRVDVTRQTDDVLWDLRWEQPSRADVTHATLYVASDPSALVTAYSTMDPRHKRCFLASLRGWVVTVEPHEAVSTAELFRIGQEMQERMHEGFFARELRAALLARDQQLADTWLRQRSARPPLGATLHAVGTSFAVFSEIAERIELCLVGERGGERRIDMHRRENFVWVAHISDATEGQRYGYRVHGPWNPKMGQRCNPAKLLLDPYAEMIDGHVKWTEAVFPYHFNDPDNSKNDKDSGPFMPKSVVVAREFDWGDDIRPRTPLQDTIIYEAHVKGMTMRHPDVPPELRGTYAGLAHPVIIEYLHRLGITAIELMPVHQFIHDSSLIDRGLRNYWGYNSINYFAPHNEYASREGEQVLEFKGMVKALHAAGIEVFLDVVYNHTAEGAHLGPVLSYKGFDNTAYYRTVADNPRYYMDYTGTGNSLNMSHPQVLQLIMDSLRFWIQEMHVDGFRFDLASTLARELHDVDRLSSFFTTIQQDPVVSSVKLIAEPWDVGEGGYQVGSFPTQWCEWNDRYRDNIRDFWRGTDYTIDAFASRLAGSADLYAATGRRPYASINFVTAHEGFTLRDLVSYNEKHNEANGENNNDGATDNGSWNCGVEGPTDDPAVNALRARQQRNFIATLFLSQGIPMMLAGDEFGQTQHGNNNAYCQDNELTWLDWSAADQELLVFTRRLIALRKEHHVFRQSRWARGRQTPHDGVDIAWFNPRAEMTAAEWDLGVGRTIGMFLHGGPADAIRGEGDERSRESFFIVFNAHSEDVYFTLPNESFAAHWTTVIGTHQMTSEETFAAKSTIIASAHSTLVLKAATHLSSDLAPLAPV